MRPLIHNNEYSVGEDTKQLGPIGAERPPLGSCVGPADARVGLGAGHGSGWKWDSVCQRASDSLRPCAILPSDRSFQRRERLLRCGGCHVSRGERAEAGLESALLTPRHTGPDAAGGCASIQERAEFRQHARFRPLAVHPRDHLITLCRADQAAASDQSSASPVSSKLSRCRRRRASAS